MVPLAHRGRSPLVTSYSVEEHGSVEPRTGKTRTGMSEGVVTVFPVRPATEDEWDSKAIEVLQGTPRTLSGKGGRAIWQLADSDVPAFTLREDMEGSNV